MASEYVGQTLRQLESQPDIAAYLLSRGLKGRTESRTCPIARYLAAEGVQAEVMLTLVYLRNGDRTLLPPRVVQFRRDFDAGLHPDLIGGA